MRRLVLRSLIGFLLLLGFITQAEPLAVGAAIPKISAQDQHGNVYTFTNGTAYLLIVLDRASAKAANQKLAAEPAGFLEQHRADYLMDIHTMPGIGRFFALKKMRKYPMRIVLIDTADTLNWVPTESGRVTVLKLTADGHIEKIIYWDAAKEPAADVFQSNSR